MCNLKDNIKENLKELKLIEKIKNYEKRGIVIGLLIALVVVAIATLAIIKYLYLKRQFNCLNYDLDDLYDDEDFDDDEDEDCCDEGCCVANEKDFEKN